MSTIAIANLRTIDITTLSALGTCQQFKAGVRFTQKRTLARLFDHLVGAAN
jgi:hypothetical protein